MQPQAGGATARREPGLGSENGLEQHHRTPYSSFAIRLHAAQPL